MLTADCKRENTVDTWADIKEVLLASDLVQGVKDSFNPEVNDFELDKHTI